MSIINRYICRRLMLYYFAFMLIMVTFVIFVDFMENIERITRHHAPLNLISLYYACFIPRVLIEISWIGFLVSILFVLGILARNNEFAAILAGGISMYSISIPILLMGLFLYAAVFGIQEFVVPTTMFRAYELDQSDFAEVDRGEAISGVAGIGKRNTFYSFDVVDVERGMLTGVHIHKMKDGAITERIDAEKAYWNEETGRWYLMNGETKKFDSQEVITESVPFSEKKAPFKESPKTLKMYSSERGELSFQQLRHQIKNLEKSGYDARRLKVKYYTKFALPAANFIVIFLALPFALECRKGGLAIGFAFSLLAALLYYGTFQIGLALGKGGSLPAFVSAWAANFLFFSVGVGLTMKART